MSVARNIRSLKKGLILIFGATHHIYSENISVCVDKLSRSFFYTILPFSIISGIELIGFIIEKRRNVNVNIFRNALDLRKNFFILRRLTKIEKAVKITVKKILDIKIFGLKFKKDIIY